MIAKQDLPFLGQGARHLKRDGLPLYLQLERILREKIASGGFSRGDIFPTEQQISGEYGVSRITVREALRALTRDGLLIRRSGKRTLVSKNPFFGAHLAAFELVDLIYGGHESETRRELKRLKIIPANLPIAETLRIPPKTKVLEVRCIQYAGEMPLSRVTVTTEFKYGRKIPKERLSQEPIIILLTDICKLQVVEMDQWTTTAQADKGLASDLGMNVGAPIAVVRRVYYDYEQLPIELSVVEYRGDRFRHHLHLRAEGTRTQTQSTASPQAAGNQRALIQ
jgi:GntR family transcriptional regulator